MTATKQFTKPQKDILVMLDGRMSPLVLTPGYRRALDNLVNMGLVSYTKEMRNGRTVYSVVLTRIGGDFIYNGGIDH